MQPTFSVIGGFFIKTILALIPALALWFWAREWLIQPVGWLSTQLMMGLFPTWVAGTTLDGTTLTLLTTVELPSDRPGMSARLAPSANLLTYCYGLPMFAALLVAAGARGLWWKLPFGALILIPFQAWGACFDLLVKVAVHFGAHSAAVTGFSALQINLIAIGYQMGFLLLPTLAPMLTWVVLERRFLATVAVDGALKGITSR